MATSDNILYVLILNGDRLEYHHSISGVAEGSAFKFNVYLGYLFLLENEGTMSAFDIADLICKDRHE